MIETRDKHGDAGSEKAGPKLGQLLPESGFAFGKFRFYPVRQILFDGTNEVRLGGRGVAILSALVERAGTVIDKDELIRLAWPSTNVDEGSLRVQMATLRKLLDEDAGNPRYILNVSRRGYKFIGQVESVTAGAVDRRQSGFPAQPKGFPVPISKVLGRLEAISDIRRLIQEARLVSIVGPGGIGKTTVALSAAHLIETPFEDGIHFVDLAAVSTGELVPFAVASAFNISADADDPLTSLISYLYGKKTLIVLDNCEHLILAAARLVEALLKGVPGLRFLTTSHEPLRAEGEWLFRLAPLSFPTDEDLSLREAMRYPAIELFVERATSDNQSLMLGDDDVPFISCICKKLDGIPLAIEIAAARVELFGIAGLAERLEDRLDVLTSGRRTAVGRHQTIRNLLDWSHENLSADERVVLRRVAVFSSNFSLDAATTIVGDQRLAALAITEAISGLVRKSLLYPGSSSRSVTYRLLESTRIYALEKLEVSGEVDRMRRLHTQFAIEVLERAEAEWKDTRRVVWLARYGYVLDDVRSALNWAFSPKGDPAAGVRLTALTFPLGIHLGLVDEFRERNEIAIAAARLLPVPEVGAEIRLNIFHGHMNANQNEPDDDNIAGVSRADRLAEMSGEDRYRIQPRFMQSGFNMGMGNYVLALSYAEEVADLSARIGDELAVLGSQRVLAQSSHFNGHHERTAILAKKVLAHPAINIPLEFGGVQTDRRVAMRIVHSRTLWMQGYADQAVATMKEAVAIAPEDGPTAICQALSQAACPILLWRGDNDQVPDYIERLLEEASKYTLRHWESWGRLYRQALEGGGPDGWRGTLKLPTEGKLQAHTLATITGQLQDLEFPDPGLAETFGWAAPEILRRRAESLIDTDKREAENLLLRSIEIARTQGARAWELRATTSLAKLLSAAGRHTEAFDRLASAHSFFTEGLQTQDVISAATLLAALRN